MRGRPYSSRLKELSPSTLFFAPQAFCARSVMSMDASYNGGSIVAVDIIPEGKGKCCADHRQQLEHLSLCVCVYDALYPYLTHLQEVTESNDIII